MIPRTGQVLDEYGRPVPGANVYVYNNTTGFSASLTSDGTTGLAQPIVTDEFGVYSYQVIADYYREDTWYGGKLRYKEVLAIGNPGADLSLRTDLAGTTGATLVGATGGTVQDQLTARPTSAALAASGGAALIGTSNGATGSRLVTAKAKGEYHLDAREFTGTWDGVADDTAGLQAAVNEAVLRGATLHLPPGFKAGAITVGGACRIEGTRSRSVQTGLASTYTGWTLNSSDIEIRNLQLNDTAKTGGYDFLLACGTATIDRTTLKNILALNGFGFLSDSGSGAGQHVTTILEDVQARGQRGPGVNFTRMYAFGSWTRVTVEYVGVSASNFTAFMVDGAALTSPGGLTINDCNALGTAGVYTNTSQIGFDLKNFSDISIPLARSDSMGGDGFRFTSTNKLEVGRALAQLCDGHGHLLTSVTNADISILRSMGRNALTGTASKDGVQIVSGCSGLSIDRIFSRDMTGHGLNVAATQAGDVDVGRVQMLSNTGRGVKTVGSSAVNIGGGQCAGNTAGNLDLGGSLHFIDNLQINAGTKADYGPGPVTA